MFARKKDILALVDLIEAKENRLQEKIDYLECRITDNRVNTEANLELVRDRHNRFVDKVREGFEMTGNDIERLDNCLETHAKWDDETREKFRVLARHFGVEMQHKTFNEQFEVIELNDNEATEITTNNQ